MSDLRIVAAVTSEHGGVLCPVTEHGVPAARPEPVTDLVAAIAARERADGPRWVWAAARRVYPRLLRAGVRVRRCHDLDLVEAVLRGHEGRRGDEGRPGAHRPPPRGPQGAPAAVDGGGGLRRAGDTVDAGGSVGVGGAVAPGAAGAGGIPDQPSLFDTDPGDDLDALISRYADQLSRLATAGRGLAMLAAAESAGALVAAEMSHDGLPWRADVHDTLLTELLGPRPGPGMRPRRLQELADRIGTELGGRPVNPDSPAQLVRAFKAAGLPVASTRSHVLRKVDHPAVPLLLEYKELARLHAAHGWAWLHTWVRDGRFRPEYVVGGVVSGRWASRGGGALQIPKILRQAVVADPGWTLVVADAAQLEPRVLAALAGDRAFAAAAAQGDLYAALAGVFARAGTAQDARAKAKIALLSAMYGGGTGEALQLLAVLRNRFPKAFDYVENAARAGESGQVVRSRLGRTSPPPGGYPHPDAGQDPGLDPDPGAYAGPAADLNVPDRHDADDDGRDDRGGAATGRPDAAARGWGRFTRNFVVQASAADWALVLLAVLRRRLAGSPGPGASGVSGVSGAPGASDGSGTPGPRPHLVFFQHDEVIVHTPRDQAETVAAAVRASAAEAGRLVFGDTPVVFPLEIAIVDRYADAK